MSETANKKTRTDRERWIEAATDGVQKATDAISALKDLKHPRKRYEYRMEDFAAVVHVLRVAVAQLEKHLVEPAEPPVSFDP